MGKSAPKKIYEHSVKVSFWKIICMLLNLSVSRLEHLSIPFMPLKFPIPVSSIF